MPADRPFDLDDLLGLLDRELSIYRKMRMLSGEGTHSIRKEDMDGLISVLNENQELLAEQIGINAEWDGVGKCFGITNGREAPDFWEKIVEPFSEQEAMRIRESLERVREMAQHTLDDELALQNDLESHYRDLRSKLMEISRGKKINKGYATSSGMFSA